MTNEQFDTLVRRLDQTAARNPGRYRTQVVLLAALGYGYLILLLTCTLALIVGVVVMSFAANQAGFLALKLIIILGAFALALIRSLWIQFPVPEGIHITRIDSAPLYASIDQLADKLGAPRIHELLLTGDYNAGVVQRPRFGMFGPSRNYLLIGLPLMATLTRPQFESVLAHELGHVRGGHSNIGGWIYRVHAASTRLQQQLRSGGRGNFLVTAFCQWFTPLFAAYSLPIRRQHEYEADRAAAENVGLDATVAALCVISVWPEYLDRTYWKPYYRQVRSRSDPPYPPFTALVAHPLHPALTEEEGRPDADVDLLDALRAETQIGDSHPSLADRLAALHAEPRLPAGAPAPEETAAALYFGPRRIEMAQRVDRVWMNRIGPEWAKRFRQAQADLKRLESLQAKSDLNGPLAPEEAWEQARLTERYCTDEEALPLYEALAKRDDARKAKAGVLTAGALFQVGKLLAERRDSAAVGYLEAAIRTHSEVTAPALETLYRYYRRSGESEAAREARVRALRHYDARRP